MTEPRRHHLLPQFYLRGFTDGADQLAVVSRDLTKRFVSSVAKAAAEGDFYTVDTAAGPSQAVEKLLSQMESEAAPALDRILAGGFPPSGDDRVALSAFMAFQLTRSRAHRRMWTMVTDAAVKLATRVIASGDNVSQRLTGLTGEVASEKDAEAFRRLAESPGDWEVVPHQNSAIEAMLQTAPTLAPVIAARKWRLARFQKPVLLTSDWPIVVWHRTDTGPYGIGVATADEIRFPLDTQHALIMVVIGADQVWDLHESHAKDINRLVAARGFEWIYHRPGTDPLAGLTLPPPQPPIEISGPPTSKGVDTAAEQNPLPPDRARL
jgi:uncharacterized protein DUF4238